MNQHPAEPIIVQPYNGCWPEGYAHEKERIAAVAPPGDWRIEHIGSTAVPGLAAKPVIDIMIGLPDLAAAPPWIGVLESLDYEYVPAFESVMPERRYFRRFTDGERRQQVHLVAWDTAFWTRHLAFRDYLRRHPEVAARYGQLKLSLAGQFRNDRDAYMDGKDTFIKTVEAEALLWRRSTG